MRWSLQAVQRPRRRTWRRGAILIQFPVATALHLAALLFLADTALPAATVPRLLLLDGVVVGNDVIVVGERGAILRSSDNARTWQRVASPVRATLTGISFATLAARRIGWAVGHDAVILGTADGGATWVRQFQGENLEESFLDVLALDAQRAIAVGAYGLCVTTQDGGKTWTRRKLTENDDHLNRITRGTGTTLFIAGEHGTLLRSPDQGATWKPLDTGYEGAFYGVVPLERRFVLAHGLRGHVFRSEDDGESWEKVATPRPALLAAGVRLRNNLVVLGGQAGSLLISRDLGKTLSPWPNTLETGVAELLELPDGNALALGEAGASRLELANGTPHSTPPPRGSP